ncbi:hypothetical protein PV326_009731, partial [Microctonus aethiopoides]
KHQFSDGSLQYFSLQAVEAVFGKIQTTIQKVEDFSCSSLPSTQTSTSKDTEERFRITWTHQDIIKLISIYKEHASLFKSQTIRNEKVWKMIAEKMPGKSTEQVKNKFKYLKGRYIKKIENMSDKASGEEKFIFEYLEEFNELFGKDPNIKPIAVASSLRKRKFNEENTPNLNKEEEGLNMVEVQENINMLPKEKTDPTVLEIPKKKEKKVADKIDKMTEVLSDLRKDLITREKERERRHVENVKEKQEATSAFIDYITFLKGKENK